MRMPRALAILALAALAGVLPHGAAAQRPEVAGVAKPVRGCDAASREHADAVRRLPTLIRQARAIPEPADRARVLALLAALESERDTPLARRLYVESFDAAGSMRTEPSDDPARRPLRGMLRVLLIDTVCQFDPELARDMLDRCSAESDGGFGSSSDVVPFINSRGRALASVAIRFLATNPDEAERLARESLRYEPNLSFADLLEYADEVNPRLGRELFFEAVARLAASDDLPPHYAALGSYVLGSFSSAGRSLRLQPDQEASAADTNPELARPFLEAARRSAARYLARLDAGTAHVEWVESVFSELTDLGPAYTRFDPEHAEEALALRERAGTRLDVVSRKHMYVFWGNGDTPELLEAEADAATDAETRRELLLVASQLAANAHPDEALRLASRIDDSPQRNAAFENLAAGRVMAALGSNDNAKAARLIADFPVREHAIRWLLDVCQSTTMGQAKASAAPWLEEVESYLLACGSDISPDRASAHMRVVGCWARIDPERAFAAAERAVRSVNACTRTPRTALNRPIMEEFSPVGDTVNDFEPDLMPESLARADYFRALRIARSYEDPALSVAAQLRIVRTALPPPAER